MILAKSQDNSPHYYKETADFDAKPNKKPPLPHKSLQQIKEKERKGPLSTSLVVASLNKPECIHKKSQSNCDFGSRLQDFQQCLSAKTAIPKPNAKIAEDCKKIKSSESFLSRKKAENSKKLTINLQPARPSSSKSNGNSSYLNPNAKKPQSFEQFHVKISRKLKKTLRKDYVFKGPLHKDIDPETHSEDLRLIKLGLQELLRIDAISADSYDEKLENRVKEFQSKYNLNVDGVFGNKCWAVMKSEFFCWIFLRIAVEELEDRAKRGKEEEKRLNIKEMHEKSKKFKDKQDKESAEAEQKLIFKIQKELNK